MRLKQQRVTSQPKPTEEELASNQKKRKTRFETYLRILKYQRKRRAEYKILRKCYRCGKPLDEESKHRTICSICTRKGAIQRNKWRNRKKAAWKQLGLCYYCNGQRTAMLNRTICAYCYEQMYEKKQARIARNHAKGICPRCQDRNAVHSTTKSGKRKVYCDECLVKYTAQRKLRRSMRVAV